MDKKMNYQDLEGGAAALEENSVETVREEPGLKPPRDGDGAVAVLGEDGAGTGQEINEVDGEPIYHADEGEE